MTGKVLVTGAAGQVGSRIVERLNDQGRDVRALIFPGERTNRLNYEDIEIMEGDLLVEGVAKKAVKDVEKVVHTANLVQPLDGMSQNDFFENNVQTTFNVAYAASEAQNETNRLVFISSSAVYPNDAHHLKPAYTPIDEFHPLRPISNYATSKLSGERIIESLARQTELRYSIVRPSGVLSGTAPLNRCSVQFVARILREGAKYPNGTVYSQNGEDLARKLENAAPSMEHPCAVTDAEGLPWLDQPVHVNDLIEGIIQALDHPAAVGEVFNISSPRLEPSTDIAKMCERITGKSAFEWKVPSQWVFSLESSKAKGMINYEPKWDFHRMLEDAWNKQDVQNE